MIPDFWSQLADACHGLLYPSETDAPVEPVRLRPPFPWDDPEMPVVEQSADDFFAELRNAPHAAGFHALHLLLADALEDLRVHRVGDVRVAVFLTGRLKGAPSDDPTRIGVRTWSVET
ncbi:MAG: nuclease A inhibitor family protein [Tepidisphaerales bacterium]